MYDNIDENIIFHCNNQKKNINFSQPKSLSTQEHSFNFNSDSFKKNELNISKELSSNTNIQNKNVIQIQSSMNLTFEGKNNVIENNTIDNINNTNNINNDNIDIQYNYYNYNYNNNYNNIISYPYIPSEKYFEILTKEINNYLLITNKNTANLKPIHLKYLNEIENLIKKGLEDRYEIKFGHYGSHFTNLSIEGSDLDILINYKYKNNDNKNEFFNDIISLLNENKDKFESINPILKASVPVIKLQIDIKKEINDIQLEYMTYFDDENELQKVKFDLTFTQNEKEYQHSHEIVSYINQSLIAYPNIKSSLLLLKRYFKLMKMNKSFHGGLSSYSLYLLIYTFCKKCRKDISLSPSKTLYYFLAFFSAFKFDKIPIDVEKTDDLFLNNNYFYNNFNIYEEENSKKEINIIDPLTKLNVAKSSFKVEEIQNTFRSFHDFLITEGIYYDAAILANKTGYEKNYFQQVKKYYDSDNNNDFVIIKKLFHLKKKSFFYKCFGN